MVTAFAQFSASLNRNFHVFQLQWTSKTSLFSLLQALPDRIHCQGLHLLYVILDRFIFHVLFAYFNKLFKLVATLQVWVYDDDEFFEVGGKYFDINP